MSKKQIVGHKIKLQETHWISGRSYYHCFCECGAYLSESKRFSQCQTSHKLHLEEVAKPAQVAA